MKKAGHPKYYQEATVSCACGNTFKVGSTRAAITVEICYKCHPLFTGEERYVDTQGQVEKFAKRREFAKTYAATHTKKTTKEDKKRTAAKSLKDLLATV